MASPLSVVLSSPSRQTRPELLSTAFQSKKANILHSLRQSVDTYTDKSPKGTVDAPIVELIDLINKLDGLVTTSSCSGRVAVFVEGEREELEISGSGSGAGFGSGSGSGKGRGGGNLGHGQSDNSEVEIDDRADSDYGLDDGEVENDTDIKADPDRGHGNSKDNTDIKLDMAVKSKVKTGPGGKGGGQWLFVSHESVPLPAVDEQNTDNNYFTKLCGLQTYDQSGIVPDSQVSTTTFPVSPPRLIRLSFSPLILHILTADLRQHARPLLAAAINAGFRESGVQSLAMLEQSSVSPSRGTAPKPTATKAGAMLAIRTAGLAFETIIGQVVYAKTDAVASGDDEDGSKSTKTKVESGRTMFMQSLVSEEYLRLCFNVINERFVWNEKRKERLRIEIEKVFSSCIPSSPSLQFESSTKPPTGPGFTSTPQRQRQRQLTSKWESKADRSRRMREEGLSRKKEVASSRRREQQAGQEPEQDPEPGLEDLNVVLDVQIPDISP